MRTWVYTYKTSDGFRHEAEMSAPTKDDVYAALRERGIRAIRVTERIAPVVHRGFAGLRKREWSLIAALVFVLLVVGGVVLVRLDRAAIAADPTLVPGERAPERAEAYPEYARLEKAVASAMASFRAAYTEIDGELLSNYALLERVDDADEFHREIARGRAVVSNGMDAVRAAYRELYAAIPAGRPDDRDAAQRLYGRVMDELESANERFDGDECAIELLCNHRGAWRVVKGEVVWDDERLAREFGFFRRGTAAKKSFKFPIDALR